LPGPVLSPPRRRLSSSAARGRKSSDASRSGARGRLSPQRLIVSQAGISIFEHGREMMPQTFPGRTDLLTLRSTEAASGGTGAAQIRVYRLLTELSKWMAAPFGSGRNRGGFAAPPDVQI